MSLSHSSTRDFGVDRAACLLAIALACGQSARGQDYEFTLLADVYPGGAYSYPGHFATYNDQLYFVARDEVSTKIYVFDGTEVKAIDQPVGGPHGAFPRSLTAFRDALLFSAYGDAEVGHALYRFDGRQSQLAAAINPGATDAIYDGFVEYNGHLYFTANDGVHGAELLRYDGFTASLVGDIRPGPEFSQPHNLTLFDGDLYFKAFTNQVDTELFKVDGNAIVPVADVEILSNMVVFRGDLYFAGFTAGIGTELMRYDGSGLSVIADLYPGFNWSFPQDLFNAGDELIFSADNGQALGRELFAYDSATVRLVKDISVGRISSSPNHFTAFDGMTFFWATNGLLDGTGGTELYVYDGDAVRQVGDVNSGQSFLSPPLSEMFVYHNELYLGAYRTGYGVEFGKISRIPEPSTVTMSALAALLWRRAVRRNRR